ncbi:UshA protein [Defluviimonas sp. 20V17]|uniref:5'-nucleotidase n=1 Tax=Allgaiera indica TaxID=765699 RepID=A0AAN4USM8_9RHOB|nr:5'-nucleotidase C-terminal domain-containing protein [Allgaiera indica]KDB02046.1 UshA protein [Defluviimonas sp. 20V17]GHE03092.1 5'-nucleotidase [Allgaiera indica]SDX11545.1 5'-nucleotidase/5'-nucleotidase / UDP-sugar diphosphatase [Allgaiera indica]
MPATPVQIRLDPQGRGARIRRAAPNPRGGLDALWLIDADPLAPAPAELLTATPDDMPGARRPVARRLRLLHVNDLHNHLADLPEGPQRMAEIAGHVARARAEAAPDEAVLFLSAGDDHTGSIFDELLGWGAEDFTLDPGYRALSAAGCDAAAIGNHEFDRGAAQLVRGIVADADFPVLSANVHGSAHLVPGQHFHAAALAEAKGLRIAIIGLTTRVETRVGQPSDPTLAVASPVEVLAKLLPLVAPLADVVVILSHCGYGGGNHASGKAVVARDIGEADFALADTAAGLVDVPCVIVGAHTHTRLNETGVEAQNLRRGILIAQAEANGRFLGEITLTPGAPPEARLIALGQGGGDAAFARAHLAPMIALVRERMEQPVGHAPDDGLDWNATRDSRYRGECALANYMNDALVAELADLPGGAPDLALLNGGSILAGVARGNVTFGQWFDVMPYSDEVFILTATGTQIAEILRSNARRLLRPDETGIDTAGFIARGFLHTSSGLRYRIDTGAAAAKATPEEIALFGQPVAKVADRPFRIAMTTYLALGSFGERWNGLPIAGGVEGDLPGYDLRALPSQNSGLVYREVLVRHIRANPEIAARPDGRLRITGG